MDNKTMLQRMGISKAEGGSLNLSTVNFETILPQADVLPMISLVRSHSAWLSEISSFTRTRSTGKVPIYDLNEPVMEYVTEQSATSPTTRPDTTKAEYQTRKHKAVIVLSHEELRESAAIDGNFEQTVVDSFAIQLGNDVANAVVNGDRTLAASSRLNKSLRGINGIDVLTALGSSITNRGGLPFVRKNLSAMFDRIDQRWRNDRSRLRWIYGDRVDNWLREEYAALGTNLGDAAKGTAQTYSPMGIRPMLCPQVRDTQGKAAINPTSVAGTTECTAVLTTLVTAKDPLTVAAGVGRKFLITCIATGQSEVCEGYEDTTLKIVTTGILGQTLGSVSTTNTDYLVRQYDETDIYLGDPKGITTVWLDEWRMFRKYNEQLDQLEITIYLELDVLMPVPGMFVKATNIAVPPLAWA